MSRLKNVSPLAWAETILHHVEMVQKDLTKLTREVGDLRHELTALRKAWEAKAAQKRGDDAARR